MKQHDYEKLAAAMRHLIYRQRQYCPEDANNVAEFRDALCDILQADNPKFNRAKFMEACK